MKKLCAYCRKEKPLTREHVWPKCFLERIENTVAHFSVKSKKVHGADYIVKDVCHECNNVLLNELDNYFCKLYDTYFKHVVWSSEEVIHFEYDYNLLSRALLKIAYNTSRAGVSDPRVLAGTAPYILGKTPIYPKLVLLMEIVSPTQITAVGSTETKSTVVPPPSYRSALMKFDTPNGNRVLPRLVGVNSYYFHLLIIKASLTQNLKNRIRREALDALSGAVCLDGKSSVTLTMSDRDGLSSMAPGLLHHHEEYKEFFRNKRSKN